MLTEDFTPFFADFGVQASWTPSSGGATLTAAVIMDANEDMIGSALSISTNYQMIYPTASLPGLKTGESVIIGADSYEVREVMAEVDGNTSHATIQKWTRP